MRKHPTRSLRAGFTLVEMIVTLIILGILVAAILPITVAQIDDAEPTKAANDVVSVGTAIELFHVNVRPTYPGDLEDLAVAISTADAGVDGTAFTGSQTNRWKGPYISAAVAAATDSVQTAFSGYIEADIQLFEGANNYPESHSSYTSANADFVAIAISGLTGPEFELINDLVDGDGEVSGSGAGGSWVVGRLRRQESDTGADSLAYYLATPYKN